MSFKDIIFRLSSKKDLSYVEAEEFMSSIIDNKFSHAQIGAMLIALNNKGVSSSELGSFVKVLRERMISICPKNKNMIDIVGTGGDSSYTFNISTISAFVVSSCGVSVAKHGNRSVSSKCGSADFLERLGIKINLKPQNVKECIEKTGIGFMFAPLFHPAFKNIVSIRKELGIRTVFNMLGPLLNPSNVKNIVIGVYDSSLTEVYAETLKSLGTNNAMVVYGDGIDEISLTGETKVSELKSGSIKNYHITPEDFGLKRCSIKDIQSFNINDNKRIFRNIIMGEESFHRDVVLLNSAAGLIVSGLVKDFNSGISLAKKAIDSGRVKRKYEELKEVSNDFR